MSNTFWASWWTGNYANEGCTKPPFKTWVSGERSRGYDKERTEQSICATVEAFSEGDVIALARKHYPDAEMRFVVPKPNGWQPPSDRFPPDEAQGAS